MRYRDFFLITYSLLPTPYSLLPTPCSLFPTPCSLLPAPFTIVYKTLQISSPKYPG
ncbi:MULTISPECIES: hypothetical protein [Moorena]|uniref:hypothetical protein n=1 Tax=Moorena TaxID=1155738 RepID=UPI0002F3D0B7|nr:MULTISPECIES: hypothetical protein [Moorena]NEP67406.1 hypothetical protein [Moorena sp. SIO3A5]NER88955.1 hypothetical protein [Moorena sp. SIO3A2]NET65625.1 hypothetical protein [Moorena sp. SIO1G6]